MKTLNITLVVVAPGYTSADEIGKKNLMEMAKIIGMKSRSSMASCTGDTKHLEYDKYEVSAIVQIDGEGDVSFDVDTPSEVDDDGGEDGEGDRLTEVSR